MTDYLTTLAARTLQLAPVALPRPASWFEPGPSASAVGDVEAEIVAAPVLPPRGTYSHPPADEGDPSAHDGVRQRSPQRAPGPHREIESPPDITEPAQRTPRPVQIAISPPSTVIAPPTRREPDVVRSEPARVRPEHENAAASAAAGDRGRATAPTPGSEAPLVETRPSHRLEERLAALERTRATGDPLDASAPTALPSTVRERSIAPIAPPPAAPIARRETSQHESDAPAIRVTIGRVEVRAIMPPPAAAPPARTPHAAAAQPSLDDYLNERNGTGFRGGARR